MLKLDYVRHPTNQFIPDRSTSSPVLHAAESGEKGIIRI